MVTVLSGFASDVGRRRELNEDSLLAGRRVFAVADGMGGHAAGDVASTMTVARLQRLDALPEITPEDVRLALFAANHDVVEAAREHADQFGMGTTVSGVALVSFAGSAHWMVFNIGDSRVYRLAGGVLSQMTVDHSEVAEMEAAGLIRHEEARNHPRGNVVTRVIGTDPPPDPDVRIFPPEPGERFVVCSDGLTRELLDDEIAAVCVAEPDPHRAARELVDLAVAAGGRDNVTVVVLDNVGDDASSSEADEITVPRPGWEPAP